MQFEVDGRGAAVDLDQLLNTFDRKEFLTRNGLSLEVKTMFQYRIDFHMSCVDTLS